MTIEEAIYSRLTADAALAALVGARIHPSQAPGAGELPVVLYGQADRKQLQTLTGVINLNAYSMSFDVWGRTYASVKAVMAALRDSLVGFSGTVGTVTVLGIFEESGDDGAEAPQHAEELGLWTASLSVAIHYGE